MEQKLGINMEQKLGINMEQKLGMNMEQKQSICWYWTQASHQFITNINKT